MTQDFNRVPSSGPTSVVVTAWVNIHIPVHRIWRLSISLFLFGEYVGAIPCGFRASTTVPYHSIIRHPAVTQDFSLFPKSGQTSVMVMAWWHIYIPIHIICRLSITLYMFREDAVVIPCGFKASTSSPWLCFAPSTRDQGFQLTAQIWAKSVMVTAWWHIHILFHSIWRLAIILYIYLERTCVPFHVGLEPQALHHGIVWRPPAVTQPRISSDFPNLGQQVYS